MLPDSFQQFKEPLAVHGEILILEIDKSDPAPLGDGPDLRSTADTDRFLNPIHDPAGGAIAARERTPPAGGGHDAVLPEALIEFPADQPKAGTGSRSGSRHRAGSADMKGSVGVAKNDARHTGKAFARLQGRGQRRQGRLTLSPKHQVHGRIRHCRRRQGGRVVPPRTTVQSGRLALTACHGNRHIAVCGKQGRDADDKCAGRLYLAADMLEAVAVVAKMMKQGKGAPVARP
jgi:hypothetical protein